MSWFEWKFHVLFQSTGDGRWWNSRVWLPRHTIKEQGITFLQVGPSRDLLMACNRSFTSDKIMKQVVKLTQSFYPSSTYGGNILFFLDYVKLKWKWKILSCFTSNSITVCRTGECRSADCDHWRLPFLMGKVYSDRYLFSTILYINTALLNNLIGRNSHTLLNMWKAKLIERVHCVE
jgi:hypothetical protein